MIDIRCPSETNGVRPPTQGALWFQESKTTGLEQAFGEDRFAQFEKRDLHMKSDAKTLQTVQSALEFEMVSLTFHHSRVLLKTLLKLL